MPLLPVAAREARGASRAGRNYAWRTIIGALGLALILGVLSSNQPATILGRQLFSALMLAAFLYCAVAGVLRTADAIAEEKRDNTLGLLFLTDLKAYDVLTGKLLASSVTIFFGLLALLPLLTIPLLMGGVSFQLIVLASLNLLNTLFLSISFGFLMSTLLREAWAAICLGLVAMLFLTFALPQLATFFLDPSSNSYALADTLMLFSPTGAFRGLDLAGTGMANRIFWSSLASVHLLGWLNILLTLHFLPIVWRDRPRSARSQIRWTIFQNIRFGKAATRKKFRTRLLESNPLFWLSGREQVSSSGLMAVLVGIIIISLTGDWRGILFGLITLHLILLVRMSSAASHSLAEDRKTGALELLLATSLSVGDVIRGRWMALGRQFFGPILIVACWHLFAFLWTTILSDYSSTTVIFAALPIAALSWIATGWAGMWFGLRSRTPIAAMWLTFVTVALVPLGVLSLVAPFYQGRPQLGVELQFSILSVLFLWSLYLIPLSAWSANRLKTKFREAATDRFVGSQPFDWRPIRRFAWRFGVTVVALAAAVFLVRWLITNHAERSFQKTLAAHPEFSRNYQAPSIPSDLNLARWNFLDDINAGFPAKVPAFAVGPRAASLRELFHSPSDYGALDISWPAGEQRSFMGQGTPKENARAFLLRNQRYDEEVARLHQAASERPHLHFQTPKASAPYQDTYLRNLHRFISTRASARVIAGERPLDDILLGVRLAASATNYPDRFDQLKILLFDSIQPIYDGILQNRWTDSDLIAIQNIFATIDLFSTFDHWRHQMTRQLLEEIENPGSRNVFIIGWPQWHRADTPSRARLRKQQTEILKVGLEILPRYLDHQKRSVLFTSAPAFDAPATQFNKFAHQALQNLARAQTAIDQVTTACAIERFRHNGSRIPNNLAELTPKYMARVPIDIALGEPLKYRRLSKQSYNLYSIAFDHRDDNGLPEDLARPFLASDWCWICVRP